MKFAAALVALAMSQAALAAPLVEGQARVEWTYEAQDKVPVDGTLWRCTGSICRGEIVEQRARMLRACLKLAGFAGRVVEFRTPAASLDTAELERCNRRR